MLPFPDRAAAQPVVRAADRAAAPAPDPQAPSASPPPGGGGETSDRVVVRRVFEDGSGMEWRVTERDTSREPGARASHCLTFDGEGIVRRVWDYPADWQALPPEELLGLMQRPVR